MERCKEYPNGRCSGCGYDGTGLTSDHAYHDHDYLCGSCKAQLDVEHPWCVSKIERATGEVWTEYRLRKQSSAADTLARLLSNEDIDHGRFKFVVSKEDGK